MKRISKFARIFAVVVVLVSSLILSNPPPFKTPVTLAQSLELTLVTYNILGYPSQSREAVQPKLQAIANEMASINPDVIAFQELIKKKSGSATTRDDSSTLRVMRRDQGKIYNVTAAWFTNTPDSFGIAIFSKYSLQNVAIKSYNINNQQRAILTARMQTPKGLIRLFVHHPHPAINCQGATELRTYRQQFSDDMVFLLGDFNLDPNYHSCYFTEISPYFTTLCYEQFPCPSCASCRNSVNYYDYPEHQPGVPDHIMIDNDDYSEPTAWFTTNRNINQGFRWSDHLHVQVKGVIQ